MHQQSKEDTIIALATPQGVGAIGVIRLSGPKSISLVNQVFKGKDLTKAPSHTIHFGTIRDGDQILDEVLVSLFIAPTSFTKEDVVEISCHGSMFILRQVIQLLVRKVHVLPYPENSPNVPSYMVNSIWHRPKPWPT